MATPSPYNFGKKADDESEFNKLQKQSFGEGSLANRSSAAQPSTPTPASPAATTSGQTGQQQQMVGGMMRTPNGSTIGQSPMNPSMNLSAGQSNTPTQTLNYATRPGTASATKSGTGNAAFDAVNHPDPKTFGENNLANRAARPVGRSMSDPQRQMEMARRNAVAKGDVSGAAKMAPGAAAPQVAGRTPNGSTIGQSSMNPSMNLSAGQSNTPTQTLNYATRPGTGKTNFDTVNKPTPETFGENNLANRAARPVGRSMSDPQRRAEMARRNAVANGGMSGAGEDEETPPGRAKGGPVQAGKAYLVGEKGPEIIVPKQSGTVVPNHAISIAELMEMKRAGKNIVLPKGAVGAKFFESRPLPQRKGCRSR